MAVVPTLTLAGFITTPKQQLEKLVEYFFKNSYSQSLLYYGTIKSLPYILQRYNTDEIELTTTVKTELTDYLSNYFDTVNINAEITTITDPNNNQRHINTLDIWVEVTKDDRTYFLEKSIETDYKTLTPDYDDISII